MQYKNVVLTNTTMGFFMAVFDANIVLISLPTIVRELGASTFDALWVIMGYILILATVLLTIGRLADIYGRIKLYKHGSHRWARACRADNGRPGKQKVTGSPEW